MLSLLLTILGQSYNHLGWTRKEILALMDAGLTPEDFAKCVNQKCRVHHGSNSLEMQLVECRKLTAQGRADRNREPFALLFRGPKTPVLVQRMYQFDFEGLGTVEIFIVPIGPDSTGMQYEAVFA